MNPELFLPYSAEVSNIRLNFATPLNEREPQIIYSAAAEPVEGSLALRLTDVVELADYMRQFREVARRACENLMAERVRRGVARQDAILARHAGSYEEAVRAHICKGDPHPDDAYLPINLWDATE